VGTASKPVKEIVGTAACPVFGVITIFLSELAIRFQTYLSSY